MKADVLVNTTSVGMHPHVSQSPVASEAINNFDVVFDAIYTPLQTRLLKVSLHTFELANEVQDHLEVTLSYEMFLVNRADSVTLNPLVSLCLLSCPRTHRRQVV